jgi:hypothetical protein
VACHPDATYGYLGAIILETAGSPFEAWKQLRFTAPQLLDPDSSGDLADHDHDGILNLFEYAFALDPKIRDPLSAMPAGSRDNGRPKLTFTRDPSRIDLTYEVLATGDLDHWTVIARSTRGGAMTGVGNLCHTILETGSGPKQVVVTDAATGAPRFLRLRVVR